MAHLYDLNPKLRPKKEEKPVAKKRGRPKKKKD
jgi:hypothetical protein